MALLVVKVGYGGLLGCGCSHKTLIPLVIVFNRFKQKPKASYSVHLVRGPQEGKGGGGTELC